MLRRPTMSALLSRARIEAIITADNAWLSHCVCRIIWPYYFKLKTLVETRYSLSNPLFEDIIPKCIQMAYTLHYGLEHAKGVNSGPLNDNCIHSKRNNVAK